MAVANLLKLAVLFIGFIGYLTGSQQPEEDVRSIQSIVQNHRDRRSIYLNAKAPILIGNFCIKLKNLTLIFNCFNLIV